MTVTKSFIYVFILFLVSSCIQQEEQEEQEKISFLSIPEIDTIKVKHNQDFLYPALPRWQYQVINDTSYLIIAGQEDGNLQLLVMNQRNLVYQDIVTIPQYGPNGFKSNTPSFYWHNPDSIFVFPTSINKIHLYDRSSQLIKTFEYESKSPMSFDANEQQQGGVLIENELFINTVPYSRPNKREFTSITEVSHSLNLNNNSLNRFTNYNPKFRDRILPTSFLGGQIVKLNKKLLLVNNFHSDSIQRYDLTSKYFENISAGISELNHLEGFKEPINNQSLTSSAKNLMYPAYYNIVSNPFNERVYRFSRHLNPKYRNFSHKEILTEVKRVNLNLIYNTLIVLSREMEKTYYKLPFNIEFAFPYDEGLIVRTGSLEMEGYDVYLRLKL